MIKNNEATKDPDWGNYIIHIEIALKNEKENSFSFCIYYTLFLTIYLLINYKLKCQLSFLSGEGEVRIVLLEFQEAIII